MQKVPHSADTILGNTRGLPNESVRIACPFCHCESCTLMSLFGGNAGESLLRCPQCQTMFHWIKWEGLLPPYPKPPHKT